MTIDFTVLTAQQYALEGRIREWIDAYLQSGGERANTGLLSAIQKRQGYWIGPAEIATDKLHRFYSPDPVRVAGFVQSMKHPLLVPPIIARYVRGKLDVTDGNHRHKAFQEKHWQTCWALIELGTEGEG